MRTRTLDIVKVAALVLWTASGALPQSIITTIAGTDFAFPFQPLPALNAPLGSIGAVAVDSHGNLFLCDADNNLVLKLDQQGILTIVAGNGSSGFSGDGGPAINASLAAPVSIAVDAAGDLFIASENRIRKVTREGIITTVAGNGVFGFSGDGGPATSASLNPAAVAVDTAGNLFIADRPNHRIRKVTTAGIITTVAGNGTPGFSGDGGPATSASLASPKGVAVDAVGNLFIADMSNYRIRKVTAAGIISTVAGSSRSGTSGDGGPATSATLFVPWAVAVNAAGDLFIADQSAETVRKVTSAGIINTVAGNGNAGFSGDGGPATSASLNTPLGVAVDAAGNLYVADSGNWRVRRMTPDGILKTVAGNGNYRIAGDGTAAPGAVLNAPTSLALDAAGNLYIADFHNNRIRKVTTAGIISTVAGNNTSRSIGDGGPATSAWLNDPIGIALDAAGNLFIADQRNYRIRKVAPDGIITTVAGNGRAAFSGDGGPATSASLYPAAVTLDAAGNLLIADPLNNRIRKITPAGIISTVAGNGVKGYSGEGATATNAALNDPAAVAADATGSLYIADRGNMRIRKVTPDGAITTVAGNGQSGFFGDGGPATTASLNSPDWVFVDAAGNLFLADTGNNRIRKVTRNGIITTIAGNGAGGLSGDGGPATSASLSAPYGGAVDAAGNLFIADSGNNRVRLVPSTPPSYQVAPPKLNFSTSDGSTRQSINLSSSVAGLLFTASADVPWLSLSPLSGSMPAVLQVSFDPNSVTSTDSAQQATITITAPNAVPAVETIPVSLTIRVGGPAPGSLAASSQSVSFALTQGAGPSIARLTLSNQGEGSIGFTATPSTTTGGSWLQLTPTSGSLTARSSLSLAVTADPARLGVGTFNGAIQLASPDTGQQFSIPVTLAVSPPVQKILLSQTGLTFTAVEQGGKPLSQSFGILNIGQGSMDWTASATSLSGGAGWLAIDPGTRSGTVPHPFTDVSTVNVLVDPSGLPPNDYYGQIQISSSASNSPQSVSVVLSVLPAGSPLPPELRPSGLIFTGSAGVTPGSQDVQIGNPSAQSTSYLSGIIGSTFTIQPANATVQPNQPAILRVYPDFSKLAPATVQRGTITLQFSDGTPKTVSVLTVVAANGPAPASVTSLLAPRDAQTACVPSQLYPIFVELGSGGAFPAGWPQTIAVKIVDDCGQPMITGSVVASFSNGDSAFALNHFQAGTWTGTWQPRSANASTVLVTVKAQLPNSGPAGFAQGSAGLQGAKTLPVLAGGPLSPVTQTEGPLAPGDLVLIRGTNLADAPSTTPKPLPSLGGASVLVAGRALNLFYVDNSQLIGQMPMDLPVNTDQQILVVHGTSVGLGAPLTVAPSHPAILAIYDVMDGIPIPVDDVHPAAPGDTLVIYCTGLGGLDQNGVLANPVSVSLGGQDAASSYAGLALPEAYPPSGPPTVLGGLASTGLGGLYQITVRVPNSLSAGPAAVVVSSAGQSSQQDVNIPVTATQ